MYKISIPISMTTVNEQTLPIYLSDLKKCRAERVFLCGIDNVYTANCLLKKNPAAIQRAISYFQENGLEVGIWISAFGHGGPLFPEQKSFGSYTSIEGIRGDTAAHALCPSDPLFLSNYQDAIRKIAALGPDLIMLDDDFRFNFRVRYYSFGCFCKYHLAQFYKRVGEEIPRDRLEKLILCGGENKYRTAYLDLMGESLLQFARALRTALDEVNPAIRLGCCAAPDAWDLCGTDLLEVAQAFAGNTAPYARISGAPYWNNDITLILEFARQQYAWGKHSGVELFSEGDTYPRPRYNVPSKPLELFDMVMLADGSSHGILNYLFEYSYPPTYETGYTERFCRNLPLRDRIAEIFASKSPVGVRVCHFMHKIKRWELPRELPEQLFTDLHRVSYSPATYLLAQNSLATAYEKTEYPALVLGVNATDVTAEDLCNGAILDVQAALILQKRGIDTGLVSASKHAYQTEHFVAVNESIYGISEISTQKIACHPKATVLSRFLPDQTPASYLYENENGQRFLVIAYDHYASHQQTLSTTRMQNPCRNYYNNYYRQADLIRAIEWLCGRPLPAVCPKNPNLYILSSRDASGATSILLCNVYPDDVLTPTVKLDRAYRSIRFVNCTGTLNGDTVTLSDLAPYSLAAFEVWE